MKKPLTFFCRQKIKFILHVFLEIFRKYCELIVLGALVMPGYANPKWYYQLVENFRVYLQGKNQLHPTYFSGDIAKICKLLAYFCYFGHAWLYTPKMIVSTYRRLRCLSAYQKSTSSINSLRYCKEIANLLFWEICACMATHT